MSSFEEDLAQVMAGHDHEAPGVADLTSALVGATGPRRRPDLVRRAGLLRRAGPLRRAGLGHRASLHLRSRRYAPLAAALAIAVVAAGSIWAGGLVGGRSPGHRPAATGRLSCPPVYGGVPARPAGVNGHARLVPRRVPAVALICAYDGRNTPPVPQVWRLSGSSALTGGLTRLAAQLTWQPRELPGQDIMCTLIGGTQVDYLIGLSYRGGGRMWVTTTQDPNNCTGSSNGVFKSFGILGPTVTQAFTSGRWPARQQASCAHGPEIGRLGQEAVMVPAGSTSLTICSPQTRLTSGYQSLVTTLNSLPTRLSTRGCSEAPGPSGPFYRLLFSYRQGPPVEVTVLGGCDPAIDNLSLQAVSASRIVPIIRQLLGKR